MIIVVLIAAVFALSIYLSVMAPTIKGYAGESRVSGILSSLPSTQYFTINDLMLKTSHGTSQIDHVVISEFGIFVIETKNYSGWIYGGINSEYWTKNMYGKKYEFRNPLHQNYAHIKALMEILGVSSQDIFIPIIAFSNKADIRIETDKNIINFRDLKKTILRYQDKRIETSLLPEYYELLSKSTDYTKEEKKAHVNEIRSNIRDKKDMINQGICPRCGGHLIQRKGKYGRFLGCSNYPKCRFTQN
ncbi:MAG: NERD domain-containing protein [Treponema sp.]|uniref:NERD domain-containing protein n=1 Tax=Treponema sp. TaxID=166 RepID=UPI00298DAB6E|nr:NERD domain-containing protein [Treponema sp.]MCQ2602120.1 NERD domain-containing protein [Treponema sp.]